MYMYILVVCPVLQLELVVEPCLPEEVSLVIGLLVAIVFKVSS